MGKRSYSRNFLLDNLFQDVMQVFTGSEPREEFGLRLRMSGPQCTAVTDNGLCLWLDALRDLSMDPASIATIHVAPGHISYKDWKYPSIWDLSNVTEHFYNSLTPADFGEVPTTTFNKESEQAHNPLHFLVEERAESRTIRLVYRLSQAPFERTLQPGILTEEILKATARVPCPRGPTCSDNIVMPCWQRRSGWDDRDPTKTHQAAPYLWHASSPLSKLLAIEGCRTLAWYEDNPFNSAALLLRSHQCIACITRYISDFKDRNSWEHFLYYDGKGRLVSRPTKADLKCSFHII